MYRTLLEDVWLSDIGRMAEVRNVPHLARCEYRVCSHWVTIIVCHFHDTHTLLFMLMTKQKPKFF